MKRWKKQVFLRWYTHWQSSWIVKILEVAHLTNWVCRVRGKCTLNLGLSSGTSLPCSQEQVRVCSARAAWFARGQFSPVAEPLQKGGQPVQLQCWASGAQRLRMASGGVFSSHRNRECGPAIQRGSTVGRQIWECLWAAGGGTSNTSPCMPLGSTWL